MVNAFTTSTVMQNFEKEFCFMEKKQAADSLFGMETVWAEGPHFQAIELHEQTVEAQQAEQQGTASTYSLYIDKGVQLAPFDRIKRLEDSQVFEVTTRSTDQLSPTESGMNLCVVQCKKVVLS